MRFKLTLPDIVDQPEAYKMDDFDCTVMIALLDKFEVGNLAT